MADINGQFPSKYLSASDIGPEGTSAVATITRVGSETIKNRETGLEERKPALFFREFPKAMLLNKTNAKKISTLLKSSDTDDWIDQPIQIYATETQFGNETVACIRVRQAALPTKAQSAKHALPPQNNPAPLDDGSDPF